MHRKRQNDGCIGLQLLFLEGEIFGYFTLQELMFLKLGCNCTWVDYKEWWVIPAWIWISGIVSFIMITYHNAKDDITTQNGKRDQSQGLQKYWWKKILSGWQNSKLTKKQKKPQLYAPSILPADTEGCGTIYRSMFCTFLLFILMFLKAFLFTSLFWNKWKDVTILLKAPFFKIIPYTTVKCNTLP